MSKHIISGPQKLVNNLLVGFSNKKGVVFNKHLHSNYYFCNFDCSNKTLVQKICSNTENKVLVGPLYSIESLYELSNLSKQFTNLKIIAASKSSKSSTMQLLDFSIEEGVVEVLPVGVAFEQDISLDNSNVVRDNALIYFKGRDKEDLKFVTKLLEAKNINYKIFKYGDYTNQKLLQTAATSKFGFVVGRTESQGIAINEMMSLNLPLFIYDSKINNYGGKDLVGTSVPYFDKSCGKIISDVKNIEYEFDDFLDNLEQGKFSPNKYILKELTHEAVFKKLEQIYLSF